MAIQGRKHKTNRHWTAVGLAMAGLLCIVGAPRAAKPGLLPITPDTLGAVLNSDSYGYDVTCIINSRNVGIVGGQSESTRLFNEATRDGPAAVGRGCGTARLGAPGALEALVIVHLARKRYPSPERGGLGLAARAHAAPPQR